MSPEAGNSSERQSPLTLPTYFRSPINTLIASLSEDAHLELSIHDLVDAYSTFSLRIKIVAELLLQADSNYTSLNYVSEASVSILRCIQRDIRRALVDPLAPGSAIATFATPSAAPIPPDIEGNVDLLSGTSVLCQQALQLVSNIFSFPALHSRFPDITLSRLLDDVLVIARSSELPVSDSFKTRSLAAWIFSTLRLPSTVIAPSGGRIQGWLNDLAQTMNPQIRACDIIHNLLSRYPDVFFRHSIGVLPAVLLKLVSVSASQRMDAVIALAGYSLAFLSAKPSITDTAIPEMFTSIYGFIRSQLPRNRAMDNHPATLTLQDYISRAAKEDISTTGTQGPRWAITTIRCLTVLSGQGIFAGTRPFRLVLDAIERVARSKRPTAIGLVAFAWKCLVWAFLQIDRDVNEATRKITPGRHPAHSQPTPREVAFDVVRQELRGGTGACLIAGLLYEEPDQRLHASGIEVRWALLVLRDMVSHPCPAVYVDALGLLERLTSGIGASSEVPAVPINKKGWNPNDIVVKELLSRRVLKASAEVFSASLQEANRFDVSTVRPLSEDEVMAHWDELIELWALSVQRELRAATTGATFGLKDPLVQTWQALLLAQTQLTQGQGHLTAPPEFTNKSVSIVAKFLDTEPSPLLKGPVPDNQAQYRSLLLCCQLWSTMRHVFSESWLSAAAGSLLTAVLHRTFDLSDERVKSAWSRLCSSLVSVSAPVLTARLASEDEEHRLLDIKRELWRVAAGQWTRMTPIPSGENTMEFLAIPLRCWTMDDGEISCWTDIFNCALTQADSACAHTLGLIDSLIQRIPEGIAPTRLSDVPAVALHLLSHLRVVDSLKHPPPFLQCINSLLCRLYSELPERISTALQALRLIRRALHECPPHAVADLLAALSDGLAVWVGDERALLLDAEYNEVVMSLYQDALNALSDVTIETLNALGHCLYSAFIRVPPPGHGPTAFCEFWTRVQPSLAGLRNSYPEEIKIALQACNDVLGGIDSQDLSFDTDSHSGSQHGDVQLLSSPPKSESLSPQSVLAVRNRIRELQRTPTARRRDLSPNLSPEVPYSPGPGPSQRTSSRRYSRVAQDAELTPPRRAGDDVVSSDHMPSSPTDALRARRLAARPMSRVAHERANKTSERPSKRRKVEPAPRASASVQSNAPRTPRQSRSVTRNTRYVDDSPEDEVRGHRQRPPHTSSAGSSTPGSATSKRKRAASSPGSSPANLPSSDDYDAWEAPICEDDVRQMSDVVPDSQPSDALEDDDDSLLPSFMKTAGRRDGHAEHAAPHSDDTIIFPDADMADTAGTPGGGPAPTTKTQGKRALALCAGSPMRTRTAPASLSLQHSQPEDADRDRDRAPGFRRAPTASAQLEELRNVYAALSEDGSQLPVGEIAAASALTHKLGALLSEKLSRRLRGAYVGEAGDGASGSGQGKGKGKERERGD